MKNLAQQMKDYGYTVGIESSDPQELVQYLCEEDSRQEDFAKDVARTFNQGGMKQLGKHEGVNTYIAVYCERQAHEVPDDPYGVTRMGPGIYFTELARMDAMKPYVIEQIQKMQELRISDEPLVFVAGLTQQKMLAESVLRDIPLDFDEHKISDVRQLFAQFCVPDIYSIEDLLNWEKRYQGKELKPLFPYFPEEIALAGGLFARYTGTCFSKAGSYAAFVNYDDIAESLRELAQEAISSGNHNFHDEITDPRVSGKRAPQFPAWHMTDDNGNGISVYNPGVGSANMLTLTELLARKRPKLGMMAGLAGGNRRGQRKGRIIIPDQVYLITKIFDHLLRHGGNGYATPSFRANIELRKSFMKLSPGKTDRDVVQFGKVATLDQRPWEVLFRQFPSTAKFFTNLAAEAKQELIESKAIAVDMEVGVLVTNFARHNIAATGALIISDVPSRGDFKRKASVKQNAKSPESVNHVTGIFNALLQLREKDGQISRGLVTDLCCPWR